MYMVPPFLAFYAADQNNETLLHESVKQCGYYRQVLQSNTTAPYKGAWEHIIGPNNKDLGVWSTGNAWAAGGMTRVLATIMKAPAAQSAAWKEGAISDLTNWIMEIINGAMASSMDAGLLRNYYSDTDPNAHGFGEISGSSMLAAVVYRMAALRPDVCTTSYISWADGIRSVLRGKDGSGNPHVTADGIATPAVNPLAWADTKPRTTGSPEGQAFVVLMYAAWRDCVLVGLCTEQSDVVPPRVSKRKLHVSLQSRFH
jgi:rhamnogalacturonyl hydrolase YesR